jgi:mannose-6-phosphate isomerase-like protein (cupin superfamily)
MHTLISGLATVAVAAYAVAAAPQPPASQEPATKAEDDAEVPGVFRGDLEARARSSDDFRRVLHTGKRLQVVLMSLRVGENIGLESHDVDQCLFIVEGDGEAFVGGKRSRIVEGSVVCVPAGARHDIINRDDEPMKLFTVYAPPQHPDGTVHETKADAQRAEAIEHGGKPPQEK